MPRELLRVSSIYIYIWHASSHVTCSLRRASPESGGLFSPSVCGGGKSDDCVRAMQIQFLFSARGWMYVKVLDCSNIGRTALKFQRRQAWRRNIIENKGNGKGEDIVYTGKV